MIINEILSHQLKSQEELDAILARCCELVLNGQATDPNHWGMVAACVVLPDGGKIFGVNHVDSEGNRIHAERAALNACETVDGRCMIVTTLSPCNRPMADRVGESCSDLIASYDIGLENIYCGYKDPSQAEDGIEETNNPKLRELCKQLADTFLKENFADGKKPGRKGLAKRSGVNTKASVSSLRKTAKHSTGEKARMAHWLANMKSGRAKAQKKNKVKNSP